MVVAVTGRRVFGLCALFLSALLAQSPELAQKSQRGKQLLAEGRFAEAVEVYRDLVKALPGNTGLQVNLGIALHMAGNDRDSLSVFQAVLKADPNLLPALVMSGSANLRLGRPAAAVPLLERACKLDPADPKIPELLVEAHALTAEQHRTQRRHRESIASWRKGLEIRPNDPQLRQELATSTYLARDYPAAELMLRKLPPTADNAFMIGDSLAQQRKFSEAIPFLVKAVGADATNLFAHAALGRSYMQTGMPVPAVPHLERAAPLDDDGSIHYQLAQAYRAAGRTEDAAKALKKYQELSSKAPSQPAPGPPRRP